MRRMRLAAPLISAAIALLLAPNVLADTPVATPASTQDLIPGPPAGPWEVYAPDTGALTAVEIWGGGAPRAQGFSNAYQASWHLAGQSLVDRLERFTSVFWAAFQLGESKALAKKDPSHDSFKQLGQFGPSVGYETTDPPDAQGFINDTIVFTHGDYVAVMSITASPSTAHETVLDQATRQLQMIPLPVGEYQAIGNGILLAGGIVFGVLIFMVAVAVVVVIVVLARSRRRSGAVRMAGAVQVSPDGRYWWDGQQWRPIPPGGGQPR